MPPKILLNYGTVIDTVNCTVRFNIYSKKHQYLACISDAYSETVKYFLRFCLTTMLKTK